MVNRKILPFQTVEFFSSFSEEELEELAGIGSIGKYPMYNILIREDDVDFTFYVILRGNVNIVKEDVVKRRHTLASLKEGECFGEVAMLKDGHRSAFVVTGLGCQLFKINGKNVEKLNIGTQIKFFERIAKSLAQKLTNLNVTALSKNMKIPMGDKSLDFSSIMKKLFPNKPKGK